MKSVIEYAAKMNEDNNSMTQLQSQQSINSIGDQMLMHQRQQSMHSLRANPTAEDENAIDEDETVMSRGQLPDK